MSLLKKITELPQATGISGNDLLLVETETGTKSILFSKIFPNSVGSASQPIYINNGKPVVCTYTVEANVPSNAVFTDTTYEEATIDSSGLMSAEDKTKLDNLTSNSGSTEIQFPFSNTAAGHNGIYRGKDLTNIYTIEEICDRISSGTFEDLYIGDYFDITITTEYCTETVRCVLAGFDLYLDTGVSALKKHHAVIIVQKCFKTIAKMNSTDITTGGYLGSEMFTTILPVYELALKSIFNNHLIMFNESLSDGQINNDTNELIFQIKEIYLNLLSVAQIFGAWSPSFYLSNRKAAGCEMQFPLFRLDTHARLGERIHNEYGNVRQRYAVRDIFDESCFISIEPGGGYNRSNASTDTGVRPYFCIG